MSEARGLIAKGGPSPSCPRHERAGIGDRLHANPSPTICSDQRGRMPRPRAWQIISGRERPAISAACEGYDPPGTASVLLVPSVGTSLRVPAPVDSTFTLEVIRSRTYVICFPSLIAKALQNSIAESLSFVGFALLLNADYPFSRTCNFLRWESGSEMPDRNIRINCREDS